MSIYPRDEAVLEGIRDGRNLNEIELDALDRAIGWMDAAGAFDDTQNED
jgi:hypothetical protein